MYTRPEGLRSLFFTKFRGYQQIASEWRNEVMYDPESYCVHGWTV